MQLSLFLYISSFVEHAISKHLVEEKAKHAVKISEMLYPYLSMNVNYYKSADAINLLRKKLEE